MGLMRAARRTGSQQGDWGDGDRNGRPGGPCRVGWSKIIQNIRRFWEGHPFCDDFQGVHFCPQKSGLNDLGIGSHLISQGSTTREKDRGGAGFIERKGLAMRDGHARWSAGRDGPLYQELVKVAIAGRSGGPDLHFPGQCGRLSTKDGV